MTTSRFDRKRRGAALLGFYLAVLAFAVAAVPAQADLKLKQMEMAIVDRDGNPALQAASHPDEVTVEFSFEEEAAPEFPGTELVMESVKDVHAELPAGLVGDPTEMPTCEIGQLLPGEKDECPSDAQVGVAEITTVSGVMYPNIYNMPPRPDELARFGMNVSNVGVYIVPEVRPNGDYALTMLSPEISQVYALKAISTTFWGVPADPSNDDLRGVCNALFGGPTGNSCASTEPRIPFLTNPTGCLEEPLATSVTINSWQTPNAFDTLVDDTDVNGEPMRMIGCSEVPFPADLIAVPSTERADTPSGLEVELSVTHNLDPDNVGAAHLRDVVVTLPEGMTINPPSADGLAGCSQAQIGLRQDVPNSCPEASKIGRVELETPLLEDLVPGEVYVAMPHENPFGSLVALYIVAYLPNGQEVKMAGRVDLDPGSGRVTTVFENNPQLPFSNLYLQLKQGPRAPLKTPSACGRHTVSSQLTPWSAPEGASASPANQFELTQGPGASCLPTGAAAPHSPGFVAGTEAPVAGAHSPFLLKLSRPDGSQELRAIETVLPKGLLGRLAGVAYCPDGAIAAAATRRGRAEQGAASCPASSHVGSVEVGAGAGSTPLYVSGEAYLAGPYRGAPLSLAIVTPAVAGPFDLGTVVVRTALYIDPISAQIRAVSDPLPQILEGIPLGIRSIALRLDRPSFTLNPTNCSPLAVGGSALSIYNQAAPLVSHFQVGECGRLGFTPKLALSLKGATKRGQHPRLRAVLTQPAGQVNIARVVTVLPASQQIDNARIGDVCTRAQFAARQCPPKSVLGTAVAETPLLDQPLAGTVYFRANGGERKLPDLVADLRGQIDIELIGQIDSVRNKKKGTSRVRTTFLTVPDAPVSRFVLQLKGKNGGLLVNNRNVCRSKQRLNLAMTAHNGRTLKRTPLVATSCRKSKSKKAKKAKRSHGKRGV